MESTLNLLGLCVEVGDNTMGLFDKKPCNGDCGGSKSKRQKDNKAIREAQQNKVPASEYLKAVKAGKK